MGQIAKFPHFFGLDLALAIGPDGLGLLQDPSIVIYSCSIHLSGKHLPNFAKSSASGVFYGQKVLFRANRLGLFGRKSPISSDFWFKKFNEIRHNVDN